MNKTEFKQYLVDNEMNDHLAFIRMTQEIFGSVQVMEFIHNDQQIWPPTEKTMTRPMYESDEDRGKEFKVAKWFEKKLDCTMLKLPIKYGLDFACVKDGKIIGFYEIKCRNNRYPDYRISMDKVIKAHQINAATMLSSTLVVTWPTKDGKTEMISTLLDTRVDRELIWAGREDRGDAQDMEPHVVIPLNHFEVLQVW